MTGPSEGYPLVIAIVGDRNDPDGPWTHDRPLILETNLALDIVSTDEAVLAFSEVSGALVMIDAIRSALVEANASWSPDISRSSRFMIESVEIEYGHEDTDETPRS